VDRSKVLLTIIGVLAGFIAGFLLANSLNRKEVEELRAQISSQRALQTTKTNSENTAELSDEEIRGAIANADANPTDLEKQRKLGITLYQYTSSMGERGYLPDIARLLKRAAQGNPKDYELIVMLGNVLFDLSQTKKDTSFLKEAREWYSKAFAIKTDDPNVRTDYGLTFFLDNPSEPEKAIAEYKKSLAIDPKHELTLQNLARALIKIKSYDEAQKRIEELRAVNASNKDLPNLEAMLAQAKVKEQS